jgi:hypothetical protein
MHVSSHFLFLTAANFEDYILMSVKNLIPQLLWDFRSSISKYSSENLKVPLCAATDDAHPLVNGTEGLPISEEQRGKKIFSLQINFS